MNPARHTSVLKIVLVVAVLLVLYALFAPAAHGAATGRPEARQALPLALSSCRRLGFGSTR